MNKKAILSNRIYLSGLTQDQMDIIHDSLKHTVSTRIGQRLHTVIINNFSRVSSGVCSIPIGRMDLIPEDFEIIDKRILQEIDTMPQFSNKLRESQQAIYDNVNESCMINAPVSWGKTFTAIALATKLKQKTLIITHTTMLRDQWVEEIEKTLGIKASVIGSGQFSTRGPIVVGNVQTISKKILELADLFGTVILDECHHVSANTFSDIIDKCKARYKIGLSGTLIRKDKKHVVFGDYFGSIVYSPEKENCLIPKVLIIDSPHVLKSSRHWANRITELENYDYEYRNFIVDLTNRVTEKGYKALVVGTRVDFLTTCASKCNKAAAITGEIKSVSERVSILNKVASGDINAIFGTMSIFSEGISQNDLSCLILASPINNDSLLTQLIGRIVRDKPDKKQPLIIDIHLKGTSVVSQAKARMSHYIRNGYEIKTLKKFN